VCSYLHNGCVCTRNGEDWVNCVHNLTEQILDKTLHVGYCLYCDLGTPNTTILRKWSYDVCTEASQLLQPFPWCESTIIQRSFNQSCATASYNYLINQAWWVAAKVIIPTSNYITFVAITVLSVISFIKRPCLLITTKATTHTVAFISFMVIRVCNVVIIKIKNDHWIYFIKD